MALRVTVEMDNANSGAAYPIYEISISNRTVAGGSKTIHACEISHLDEEGEEIDSCRVSYEGFPRLQMNALQLVTRILLHAEAKHPRMFPKSRPRL